MPYLLPRLLALLIPAGFHPVRAPMSDLVGVYALIDRVVIEGDAANPKAIQVWGVFSLADRATYMGHTPAQRGYLYYSFNPSNERATLAEWTDLKAVAGTGETVAFGARNIANGRVRQPSDPAANPDLYPLATGVNKLPTRLVQPQEISEQVEHELRGVPAPLTPAEGASVPPGAVRLVARNAALPGVQYVFQIAGPGSAIETSAPIPAGTGQTAWTPRMQLRTGASYTWRVWTIEANWRSQLASASFRTN